MAKFRITQTTTHDSPWNLFIYFIYLIIEAKQSNAISKNHNKRVIIVSAAKDDEG